MDTRIRMPQDLTQMSKSELADQVLRLSKDNIQHKQLIKRQDEELKKTRVMVRKLTSDLEQLKQRTARIGRWDAVPQKQEMLNNEIWRLKEENKTLKKQLKDKNDPTQYDQAKTRRVEEQLKSEISQLESQLQIELEIKEDVLASLEGAKDTIMMLTEERQQLEVQFHQQELHWKSQISELGVDLMTELESKEEVLTRLEAEKDMNYKFKEEIKQLGAQLHQQEHELNSQINQLESQLKDEFENNEELVNRLQAEEDTLKMLTEKSEQLQGQIHWQKERYNSKISKLKSRLQAAVEKKEEVLKSLEDAMGTIEMLIEERKQHEDQMQLNSRISQLEFELMAELKDKEEVLTTCEAERMTNKKLREENKHLHQQDEQLKSHIVQLESALMDELRKKQEVLSIGKAERERNEKLREENKQLHQQDEQLKSQIVQLESALMDELRKNHEVRVHVSTFAEEERETKNKSEEELHAQVHQQKKQVLKRKTKKESSKTKGTKEKPILTTQYRRSSLDETEVPIQDINTGQHEAEPVPGPSQYIYSAEPKDADETSCTLKTQHGTKSTHFKKSEHKGKRKRKEKPTVIVEAEVPTQDIIKGHHVLEPVPGLSKYICPTETKGGDEKPHTFKKTQHGTKPTDFKKSERKKESVKTKLRKEKETLHKVAWRVSQHLMRDIFK